MKKIVKYIFRFYQHFLFKSIIEKSSKPLLLLDIDNTLADTWPSLNKKWDSEVNRIFSLPPLQPVIDYLYSTYPIANYEWIFLTSRSYKLRKITINWLLNQKLPASNENVILVQSPNEKIALIKNYVKKCAVYFDDLSYNQENGEIKFYLDEIEQCKRLNNVQYFGSNYIIEIINNYDQNYK